ncbi:carboxyl-terminal processing protease [Actimicrobium sp. GrIS 1.19]|uniref:S41 family peptidase n=1 Tax=Actimicrobium sp. GrIS 1.19 TaxID=3071708 RepID=UPI002E02A342|nr:carboxyl-terminal processing protease [Actimicrobium sp. GrIS 1.19]
MNKKSWLVSLVVVALLSACGGGGGTPGACSGSAAVCSGSTNTASNPPASATAPEASDTAPPPMSASVEKQCEAPRPANTVDPLSGRLYGDTQGSLTLEKQWIRAYVNETYLWFDEVAPVRAASYVVGATVPFISPSTNAVGSMALANNFDVVDAYFNSQRSTANTASGKPKDQFHFTYRSSEWAAMAGAGESLGFGFEVALVSATPPRKAVVAFTAPGSTAAQNGIARGAQFVSVNGVDVASGSDTATLNEALFSPVAGKSYVFQVLDIGSAVARTVTMTAATVTSVPVQNVGTLPAPNASVGYMLFNDHIATAEAQLVAAVNQLKAANSGAGVSDLVLDLRYNGGGYLDIASELAYMIAGPTATSGKVFEKLTFNSKNPFGLSDADKTTPFHSTTQGFSLASGQSLPQLGLSRVFVLTGSGTCSASEAIINGLRGVGVTVIQVGGTTCGKPYGFFAQDNCSTTYFTIQFKGVNEVGYGDYADGFVPAGSNAAANSLPGCAVADDFTKALGNPAEGRLAAALQYRANGTCPAPLASSSATLAGLVSLNKGADPALRRNAFQQNRIYRPAGH